MGYIYVVYVNNKPVSRHKKIVDARRAANKYPNAHIEGVPSNEVNNLTKWVRKPKKRHKNPYSGDLVIKLIKGSKKQLKSLLRKTGMLLE